MLIAGRTTPPGVARSINAAASRSPKGGHRERFICACRFRLHAGGVARLVGGETVTVKMKSLSYDPKELGIRVGDSVVWTNNAFQITPRHQTTMARRSNR